MIPSLRGAKATKQSAIKAILLISVLIGSGGCRTAVRPDSISPTKIILKATRVNAPPTVDGVLSDPAWTTAVPLTVETRNGPPVKLRAVINSGRVYIQASWADSTKNDMDTPWFYDGATWKKEPGDDVLILLWNIDNSINDFNDRGASIVKQMPRSFARVRGFEIPGVKPKTGLWPGRNQKGDIWDLALGLTNPLGLANDLYMGVDPKYLENPADRQPKLVTLSDAYTTGTPWIKNFTEMPDGTTQPIYRFKTGRNPDNTPKPTLGDVEQIQPGDTPAIGEISPYYIFENGKNWGGSMDDVKGKGVWRSGVWETEMSRKLNTGNKDDIRFDLKSGPNYFVFSAMIRDGDSEYYSSPPIALEIVK
jgi:hypothetical protein